MSPTTLWTVAALLAVLAVLALFAGGRLNTLNARFDKAAGGRSGQLRPEIVASVLAVLCVVFALLAIFSG